MIGTLDVKYFPPTACRAKLEVTLQKLAHCHRVVLGWHTVLAVSVVWLPCWILLSSSDIFRSQGAAAVWWIVLACQLFATVGAWRRRRTAIHMLDSAEQEADALWCDAAHERQRELRRRIRGEFAPKQLRNRMISHPAETSVEFWHQETVTE